MKKIVWIVNFLIIVTLGIAALDVFGYLGVHESVTITIQENENLTLLSQKLKDEHVIISEHLFKWFYRFRTNNDTIHPGTITVSKNDSYQEITRAITLPSTNTVRITIPEGFEIREIVARFVNNELVPSEDEFYKALNNYRFTTKYGETIDGQDASLSGYLFPDTYEISKESTPEEMIRLMITNFETKWTQEHQNKAEKLGFTMKEVITLASIIEREARKADDFPLVSSVFHNRLKADKKLESCATVQYILQERKAVLSTKDTKINSPYNTYRYKGLPPHPIASPGMLAIEAALSPESTEYFYFFTDKNGDNHYSKTFEEHNQLIRKYGL